MTYSVEDVEGLPDAVRLKWEWFGKSGSVLFPRGSERNYTDHIIRIGVESAIEYWTFKYDGAMGLKEFAGFSDEDYSEYIASGGEEIGEISDARIERIKQNGLTQT